MINQLVIRNFKSIKDIAIPCKKLNVFIGEPNGGKSNIIEALSLMSEGAFEQQQLSKEIFRYKSIGDLFFDFNFNKPIEIETGQISCKLQYAIRSNGVPENEFHFKLINPNGAPNQTEATLKIDHSGKIIHSIPFVDTPVRYYQFKRLSNFQIGYRPHLSSPFGENLPLLLMGNEEYRNWVTEFFEEKGFTLTFKPTENEVVISKIVNKNIFSYNYQSVSETLQRIVFYIMAIKSNKDAILLFDEPETNTFPFYTKLLAERIALDESNQFFLTTHNPYMLQSLIEKSNITGINVCIVRMKNYETTITPLNNEQLGDVLDFNSDVFFNLDRIID